MNWKTKLDWDGNRASRLRALLHPEGLLSDLDAALFEIGTITSDIAMAANRWCNETWQRRLRIALFSVPDEQISKRWTLYGSVVHAKDSVTGIELHLFTDGIKFLAPHRDRYVFAPGASVLCAMRTVELGGKSGRSVDHLAMAWEFYEGATWHDVRTGRRIPHNLDADRNPG